MIILNDDTQKFQAVLAGAVNSDQPEFQASYGQLDADGLDTYATNQGELNSTTDVDLVAGVAGKQLGIKSISVFNKDDAQVIITFKKDISATDRFLYRVVLEVNESVHYESDRGWYVTSASGAEKSAESELHTGQVTGGTALTLVVAAITGQTALASGLASTDELVLSDGGVIKRMDISVIEAYMLANLGFIATGAELNDLTASVTWANVPEANVPTHTGEITGGTALVLDVTAITAKSELTTGLVATDELVVNDGGVIKRIDLSVLEEYIAANITGLTFGIQFFIEAGDDATYVIDQSASFGYTIIDAVAETVSGSITMAVKIEGTDVTGISAMAITSTESTDTASAANVVAAGDLVIFVFSSNSSAVGLSVKLNCTRA